MFCDSVWRKIANSITIKDKKMGKLVKNWISYLGDETSVGFRRLKLHHNRLDLH